MRQLPAGSRWVTELDDEPAAAALTPEMA